MWWWWCWWWWLAHVYVPWSVVRTPLISKPSESSWKRSLNSDTTTPLWVMWRSLWRWPLWLWVSCRYRQSVTFVPGIRHGSSTDSPGDAARVILCNRLLSAPKEVSIFKVHNEWSIREWGLTAHSIKNNSFQTHVLQAIDYTIYTVSQKKVSKMCLSYLL